MCDTFEPSRAPTGKCAILQKVKLPSDTNLSELKFEMNLTQERFEPQPPFEERQITDEL